MLNRGHGSWGIGFLLASLAGTGAVATVLIIRPMVASPPRIHSGGARSVRRLALPTAGVLLIMAFALSGYMMEDSSRTWSVIYLRDNFHPDARVATLNLPAFIVTLTIGRFVADGLIDRHGPVRVAIALVVVSAVGLALVSAAQSVAMALAGFALIGLGVSTAQPQALSAVARLGDRPSSLNVASFATLQTVLSFFGTTALWLRRIALWRAHLLRHPLAVATAGAGLRPLPGTGEDRGTRVRDLTQPQKEKSRSGAGRLLDRRPLCERGYSATVFSLAAPAGGWSSLIYTL
jgi:MFS family permease